MDKIESRRFWGFQAKSWALAIGCAQVIFSLIFLGAFAFLSVTYAEELPEAKEENDAGIDGQKLLAQIRAFVGVFIGVVASVIGLIAGCLLITGVKTKNVRKMRIWVTLEANIILFSLIGVIVGMFLGGETVEVAVDVVVIVLGLFFILVVNIHRYELLNRNPRLSEHPFLN